VLRVIKSLYSVQALVLFMSSLFMVGCSTEGDLLEIPESDPVFTPSNQADQELTTLHHLFFGEYGCQSSPAQSIINYDSDAAIEEGGCESNEDVRGSNPTKLFSMSQGAYTYLDTEIDANRDNEYLAYADQGAVYLMDLQENSARRISTFAGLVCRLIPSHTYERVLNSATNTETWHELNDEFFYVELIVNGSNANDCSDPDKFRSYVEVSVHYDALADDFEVCADEEDGRSNAADCKTRELNFDVTSAEAFRKPVKAYVLDEDTADANDRELVFGYLGWSTEERKLKFWDSEYTLVDEQDRLLETFAEVNNLSAGAYNYVANLTALTEDFYLYQLGRDLFLFQGRDLFEATTFDDILSDRIYLLDEQTVTDGTAVSVVQAAFDDDDLLIFDNGKFFHTDYTSGYTTPATALSYEFVQSLANAAQEQQGRYEFSQFNLQDCQYDDDSVACDAANAVGDVAWAVAEECEVGLGCSIPTDGTDYCVTDAEQTGSEDPDDLCTPSRYQDLNELDESGNNMEFKSFIQYYADYMRGLDFQMYNNKLLLNLRLTERDALVVYDFNQALGDAFKPDREVLLFGAQEIQSIEKPIIQDGGIYVNSLVQGATVANVCYKGFTEVTCDLSNDQAGSSGVCTGYDLDQGDCREGRYLFESRALYCTDAQVATDCDDDNQLNTVERQIEGANQDAKWVLVLKVDPAQTDIQREMRALISNDRQESTDNPTQDYVSNEGVLGNPTLYTVDVSTLATVESEGQLLGEIESLPGALVLRGETGYLSATEEEFLSGNSVRTQSEYFVSEALNAIEKVTDSQKSH